MKNLKEIARETGFSTRTITRALYNDKEIKPETREKIVQFCEAVNYSPNFAARSLKLKRTNIIGLIRFYLNVDIDNKRIAVITDKLAQAGYHILQGIGRQPEETRKLMSEFRQKCDGLIIYAQPGVALEGAFRFLKEKNYPFVLIDPSPELGREYPSLLIDREAGVAEAVRSLGASGKNRIAFLTPYPEYGNRFPGFKAGLESLGIAFSNHQIIQVPVRPEGGPSGVHTDQFIMEEYMEGGYSAALNNPLIGRDFNAVFCFNDHVALGCLRALYERGIKVPEQVAVVGFDDAAFCGYTHVPLSTVRQPVEAMAQAAVTSLLDQLAGKTWSSQKFSTEFVKRRSS